LIFQIQRTSRGRRRRARLSTGSAQTLRIRSAAPRPHTQRCRAASLSRTASDPVAWRLVGTECRRTPTPCGSSSGAPSIACVRSGRRRRVSRHRARQGRKTPFDRASARSALGARAGSRRAERLAPRTTRSYRSSSRLAPCGLRGDMARHRVRRSAARHARGPVDLRTIRCQRDGRNARFYAEELAWHRQVPGARAWDRGGGSVGGRADRRGAQR
jgi:hypothetical protein